MAKQEKPNSIPYLDDSSIAKLGVIGVLRTVAPQVQACPDKGITPEQKTMLENVRDILSRTEAIFEPNKHLFLVKMMVLGKLGIYAEAIKLSQENYAKDPSWNSAIVAANAYRRSGDLPQAIIMFRKACEHNPEDVHAWMDVGDLSLELKLWAQALEAYQEALGLHPGHPWALPSMVYCQYRVTNEKKWLNQLRRLAHVQTDEGDIDHELTEVAGSYTSEDCRRRANSLLSGIRD